MLQELIALYMVVGDFAQYLANDLVLALAPAEIGMIAMVRIHLLMHGRGQLQHLCPSLLQLALGIGQHFVRRDIGFHHQLEFLAIPLITQPPAPRIRSLPQILLQPLGKILQRCDRFGRYFVVAFLELRVGPNLLADVILDQARIAVVFLCRHLHENGISIH